jgi:CheY-like chemotaxis protein
VHRETTGDRAIAALDGTKHFSGLVTDIRMPGRTTGWDVAHHARRANPDIAVVYTSGDSGHAHRTEGVPGSTFVQKPFVPDQVTTAVSTRSTRRRGSPFGSRWGGPILSFDSLSAPALCKALLSLATFGLPATERLG